MRRKTDVYPGDIYTTHPLDEDKFVDQVTKAALAREIYLVVGKVVTDLQHDDLPGVHKIYRYYLMLSDLQLVTYVLTDHQFRMIFALVLKS